VNYLYETCIILIKEDVHDWWSYFNFHHKLEIATLLLYPGWGPAVFYYETQAELIARNTWSFLSANEDCLWEK